MRPPGSGRKVSFAAGRHLRERHGMERSEFAHLARPPPVTFERFTRLPRCPLQDVRVVPRTEVGRGFTRSAATTLSRSSQIDGGRISVVCLSQITDAPCVHDMQAGPPRCSRERHLQERSPNVPPQAADPRTMRTSARGRSRRARKERLIGTLNHGSVTRWDQTADLVLARKTVDARHDARRGPWRDRLAPHPRGWSVELSSATRFARF